MDRLHALCGSESENEYHFTNTYMQQQQPVFLQLNYVLFTACSCYCCK